VSWFKALSQQLKKNHKKNVVHVRQVLDSHLNSGTAKYAVLIASRHTNISFVKRNISRDCNVSTVRTVIKQDRQCTSKLINRTVRRVRETTVAVEKQ
jgi:hypothetical protein